MVPHLGRENLSNKMTYGSVPFSKIETDEDCSKIVELVFVWKSQCWLKRSWRRANSRRKELQSNESHLGVHVEGLYQSNALIQIRPGTASKTVIFDKRTGQEGAVTSTVRASSSTLWKRSDALLPDSTGRERRSGPMFLFSLVVLATPRWCAICGEYLLSWKSAATRASHFSRASTTQFLNSCRDQTEKENDFELQLQLEMTRNHDSEK